MLKTVMNHPVGPVPLSMFHEDISESVKSDLYHMLESTVQRENEMPTVDKANTIFIMDAMAIIQILYCNNFSTFNDIHSIFHFGSFRVPYPFV